VSQLDVKLSCIDEGVSIDTSLNKSYQTYTKLCIQQVHVFVRQASSYQIMR
jgi:hypothetical protein